MTTPDTEPTGVVVDSRAQPARPGSGYVWASRIDPNCGDPGLFVNQNNELRVQEGAPTAITGMRIILNNQFAPMPVCGHNYAAAQFIGRGSTEFSMQITGVGDNKISDIQAMHEELEQNARLFRKFDGAARVRFSNNQFLRLAGIYDGIITSVDTETDSGGTNLYRCQISFTSDGHHTESFNQEMHIESDVLADVVEGLLTRVNATVLGAGATRALESDEALALSVRRDTAAVGRQIGEYLLGDFGEVVVGGAGQIVGSAWGWAATFARGHLRERHRGGVGDSGVAANITSIDGLLESARQELDVGIRRWVDYARRGGDFEDQQERRGAYLLFPVETDVPDDQDESAIYSVTEDPNHPWVNQYSEQLREILTEWMRDLPGHTFFRGARRGQYRTYENQGPVTDDPSEGTRTQYEPSEGVIRRWPPMLGDETSTLSGMVYGRRRRWRSLRNNRVTGRNSIEGNLFEFESAVMGVAQLVLAEAQGNADFNEVFPGIQERWLNSPRSTSHPTYPDLNLPPHPVSQQVIDTEPDFYFFNDGEEGLLNDIGPDLRQEIDDRVQNMERSYARLASGVEWRETYLGRSRVATEQSEDASPEFFDYSSDVEIDPSTNEGSSEEGGWGRPEGGRVIGGGSAAITDSVVDQVLGMSPVIQATQNEQGVNDPRVQQRISMMRASAFPLPQGDTDQTIAIGPVDTQVTEGDRSHSFSRNAVRTIVQQSIAQAPEHTLTMRRAFPSFKIYFVEDDIGARHDNSRRIIPSGGTFGSVRPIMFFDDLYNYNSVKAIRLIRSRKNPADLLVLTLTNVQGLLERRQWTPPGERDREVYAPGFEDTELENPLKKIIMKEGLKVQARLGYCVDEKTEILTKQGWKTHEELVIGDVALTLNHETGFSEWQPVENINKFEASGDLVSLEGVCHSSLTTENHRWPVLRQTTSSGKGILVREWATSNKLNTAHRIIGAAGHNPENTKKVYEDSFVELVAWFWTEGHITNNRTKNRNPGIVISQSSTANPEFVKRIYTALEEYFGPPSESLGSGGKNKFNVSLWKFKPRPDRDEVEFRLNSAASSKILEVAPDKVVSSEFIYLLSNDQLELFVQVSNMGDGHYSKGENQPLLIGQKKSEHLDSLELAAILAGYRTRRYFANYTYIDRNGDSYYPAMLYMSRNREVHIDKRYVYPKKKHYSGIVWCPTLKNGSWLARRNGITHFTGNSNNPNKIGIKFVGEVVEYSYNAGISDEVTIICQSYGAELTLQKKGIAPGARNTFIDTPDLLHTLMCSPELVHFGRYDLNPQFNPAEARSAATSRADPSTGVEGNTRVSGRLIADPRALLQEFQELIVINRSKWILGNNAADDNVFAPGIRDHLSGWERFRNDIGAQMMWGADWIEGIADTVGGWEFLPLHAVTLGGTWVASHIWGWIASGVRAVGNWLNDGGFQLSGQTIWEVLKECELRHPGYVAHPRPYGTRNTLFFGMPSHRYWADQQTREEMVVLQRLESAAEASLRGNPVDVLAQSIRASTQGRRNLAGGGTIETESSAIGALGELASLSNYTQQVWMNMCRDMAVNRYLQSAGEYLATTLGRFKPFRRYHLITSDHHLLMNNIRASKRGTFNAVTLQYGSGNVYTLKADDSIPDELTRVQPFNYPSCDNETLARRYCIGLLNRHLKDVYKGEIIVTGMDVDPYDLCYLHDDRLGMYGGFEIEQVVDTFTPETGWITEITPDLITGTNNWSTRSTSEARMAVLGTLSHRYLGYRMGGTEVAGIGIAGTAIPAIAGVAANSPGVGIAAAGVIAAGGALAWMGGYHIIRWSQDRQPIWVCPLILGERPFFAGLDGFRQDGIFASIRGELHAQFDAVEEGWRQFHLGGFANDIVVGFSRALGGQNPGQT